jgi:hypothetical protein
LEQNEPLRERVGEIESLFHSVDEQIAAAAALRLDPRTESP